MDLETLHLQAVAAAQSAAQAYLTEKLGGKDNYPCGFARVKIFGVKMSTKEGKIFAKLGFRKSYTGGIELSNPSRLLVQNVDVKAAGAEAYAKVFTDAGYKAYAADRLD